MLPSANQANLPVIWRVPLMAAAFASLVLGINAGLLRLGLNTVLPSTSLIEFHGPLMVCGFLGTLITLERAVALGNRLAYIAPLATAIGAIVTLAGEWQAGAMLFVLSAGIYVICAFFIWQKQPALFTLTLLLGALCWLIGDLLWLCRLNFPGIVIWWAAFLVLTIAGERLELSRLLQTSRVSEQAFITIIALLLAGVLLMPLFGMKLFSATLLTLTLWLLRHDIARRTIKQSGLTRFIAICLLSGYAWLPVAALIGLLNVQLIPGAGYDAFLHAIFVGFVFAMIFGHALVIFPAVVRVRIAYTPLLYMPLALLHSALLIRVAGDFFQISPYRQLGGALTALALLLFVFIAVLTSVMSARKSTQLS
ncbi:DNA internalization-related competence protein ComEC/Rec2 [Novimethylophilus kurashikiensis]|uniref:DNA internalization-related competence protein ComEC/Rec2 n=1 Tax=Novimethylophilus kurashikiensis TaxID=1825523 RepID=A0A2R5F9L6_9PROT|nr:hypothetical protein [Novimethylophilus kurashikiensis]GBG14932.1 DNA internalization-related competence protein ComEC/Rec2 [Novimethylophilus kurashikiensis]